MQSITLPELTCIGVVHGDIVDLETAPKNYSISDHSGVLEIDPRYLDAMDGIKAGMTIVVLFWLHRSSRDVLKVYPRGDRSRGLSGVFATRSPVRPNPIALSELRVLSVEGNRIEVYGLDVLDGTPIIDIKKQISA
nr:tRNA (N6-threonylcarbamoyladenosine(37)-N6)-methyltransferase TrmO [uncultured Desulfobulbus sp.]